MKFLNAEPFRIKVIEPIKKSTRPEREEWIKKADFNVFRLEAEQVYIDMITDSGTSAMSSNQWAGVMKGDESYAGSKSFYNLRIPFKILWDFHICNPLIKGEQLILLCHNCMQKKEDIF